MKNTYIVVEFPAVQYYMEEKWFETEAILINDDNGLNQFGSSAYMIPIERINKNKLYKLRSGDESVHAIVWTNSVEEAIKLANTELKDSCELFDREVWEFDNTMIVEINLLSESKMIDFIDAYTF